jgi:hypothetical protein
MANNDSRSVYQKEITEYYCGPGNKRSIISGGGSGRCDQNAEEVIDFVLYDVTTPTCD